MEPTLILFAHPALERSHANKRLIEGVADIDGLTIHDLYQEYPDFHIDVAREKELMEAHSRIVWQHPLYWYSTPALFKEWFDVVLQYGWAYGQSGTALVGKRVKSVITAGGSADAYQSGGHNNFTMRELLRPLEQTARLCGMTYEEPMVFHGALHFDDDKCAAVVKQYRDWLLQN